MSLNDEQKKEFVVWLKSLDKSPSTDGIMDWINERTSITISSKDLSELVRDALCMIAKEGPGYEDDCVRLVSLPGFGLPSNSVPDRTKTFPVLLRWGDAEANWNAATLLIREVCMLKFMDIITDKPEWWIKVRNPEIADKWKKEALEKDWAEYRNHADFTEAMANACIKELLKKADMYEATGLIPVYDYSVCVIKSDKLMSTELKEELQSAVAALENVPEAQKDWHPGSGEQVLDLVHPSLWPLIYGRSRILRDRMITVQNCLAHSGMGTVVPQPNPPKAGGILQQWRQRSPVVLSTGYQWLPCDVKLTAEGAKIDSYINNLHPVKHAKLYPVIEKFIERSLPAWDLVWRWPQEFDTLRLYSKVARRECRTRELCRNRGRYSDCVKVSRPLDESEEPRVDDEEREDGYEGSERERRDQEWYSTTHPVVLPDMTDGSVDHLIRANADDIKTSGFFNDGSRIQVIVKLANIHLTPEKPKYEGGSWHVEGQLNEHICATAFYYYDSENISEFRLDFRTIADSEELSMGGLDYQQGDFDTIDRVFAIDASGSKLQDIGSVTAREDRALFFSNLYQHHVSPFSLVDPTKPGHRKILALFLVDPSIPIISTANVPPQRKDWWEEKALPHGRTTKLPPEVMNMVVDNVDFAIDEEEAKKIRLELMDERSTEMCLRNGILGAMDWNF